MAEPTPRALEIYGCPIYISEARESFRVPEPSTRPLLFILWCRDGWICVKGVVCGHLHVRPAAWLANTDNFSCWCGRG